MKIKDDITSDFIQVNDSTLAGYVVRSGPYQYGEKIKYKNGKNLKTAYNIPYAIAYGSREADSHTEADDRMIGYFDNFVHVPKGHSGVYGDNDIDDKYDRIHSVLHTSKPIEELSDLKEFKNLPVSGSYEDLGEGDHQVVGKVYHIAVSLNANEKDRCSTAGGPSCNVSLKNDFTVDDFIEKSKDMIIHDQNLMEVISTEITDNDQIKLNKKLHKKLVGLKKDTLRNGDLFNMKGNLYKLDFDNNNKYGILSVATDLETESTQPPTNKIKSDETMGKIRQDEVEGYKSKVRKKEAKEEKKAAKAKLDDSIDGDTPEISEEMLVDLASTDDDDIESHIKGDPYKKGGETVMKKKIQKKDLVSIDIVKDLLEKQAQAFEKRLKNATKDFRNEKAGREAKQVKDLKETLIKEPYEIPEDIVKDMNLTELIRQKEIQDSTERVKDFYETQDLGYRIPSYVNTKLFDEGKDSSLSIVQDMINSNFKKYWSWYEDRKDFFTPGVGK